MEKSLELSEIRGAAASSFSKSIPDDSAGEIEAQVQSFPSSTVNPSAQIHQSPERTPYHVLNKQQKWMLVYVVSLAGMFSPLSSNIYFPAIDTISLDLHTNRELVALTITVYMVVQGIAPSFWGPWSDSCGRRIIFIWTLSIYAAANLALAFTVNYPMLLVLRGVQAAGSSATISIGTGVIADIAAPSESMYCLLSVVNVLIQVRRRLHRNEQWYSYDWPGTRTGNRRDSERYMGIPKYFLAVVRHGKPRPRNNNSILAGNSSWDRRKWECSPKWHSSTTYLLHCPYSKGVGG